MDWVEDLHQAGVRHGQIRKGRADTVTGGLCTLLDQVDASNKQR